jgi:hypothetical protein
MPYAPSGSNRNRRRRRRRRRRRKVLQGFIMLKIIIWGQHNKFEINKTILMY